MRQGHAERYLRTFQHAVPPRHTGGSEAVVVKGVTDVWVKIALCCTPIPNDEILGYVTRGGGVSVHARSCTNTALLLEQPERLVEVEWAPGSAATSAGAYLSGATYLGVHGLSRRLDGLDPTNAHAAERGIVIHAAWYAGADVGARQGKPRRGPGRRLYPDRA